MANNIVQFDDASSSPFDSIRRVDAEGKEFWSARELMGLLGFERWQQFKGSIDVARDNVESSGSKALDHFLFLEIRSQGRPALDFHMSRLACYHTVLACDSRGKPFVKAAKHYFAVKTREAEVVIPAQNEALQLATIENENLKLQNENLKLQIQVATAQQGLESFRHVITSTCPEPTALKILGCKEIHTVEYRDRVIVGSEVVNDGGTVNKTELCYRYGILTRNGKPDYKRLNDALANMPSNAFKLTARIQENQELLREFLPQLDAIVDSGERNLWTGEN
jgi:hypothetical protein